MAEEEAAAAGEAVHPVADAADGDVGDRAAGADHRDRIAGRDHTEQHQASSRWPKSRQVSVPVLASDRTVSGPKLRAFSEAGFLIVTPTPAAIVTCPAAGLGDVHDGADREGDGAVRRHGQGDGTRRWRTRRASRRRRAPGCSWCRSAG